MEVISLPSWPIYIHKIPCFSIDIINQLRSTKAVQNEVKSNLWKFVSGFVSSNKHLSHHLVKNMYAAAHVYITTLFSICIV